MDNRERSSLPRLLMQGDLGQFVLIFVESYQVHEFVILQKVHTYTGNVSLREEERFRFTKNIVK